MDPQDWHLPAPGGGPWWGLKSCFLGCWALCQGVSIPLGLMVAPPGRSQLGTYHTILSAQCPVHPSFSSPLPPPPNTKAPCCLALCQVPKHRISRTRSLPQGSQPRRGACGECRHWQEGQYVSRQGSWRQDGKASDFCPKRRRVSQRLLSIRAGQGGFQADRGPLESPGADSRAGMAAPGTGRQTWVLSYNVLQRDLPE